MAQIEFKIQMNCTVEHDVEAEVYVSHCPTLDVFSQGDTEEEAMEAIKSAVTMHLTTAFEFNRLDKVLRRSGFETFSPGDQHSSKECEFVDVTVKSDKKVKQVPITVPLRFSQLPQADYASIG